MERIKRLDRSRTGYWAALFLLGVGMLGLNWLTPLLADDYTYVHSWADWSIIKSPFQIPASMYQHGFKMNGRIVSHAFEQLFLIPPKHVFDLCNAAVFVWLLAQCHRICVSRGRSLWVLLLCGMGIWYFMPVFGQVCLWQDGAVNYLWSLAFGLFCLRPYLSAYLAREGEARKPLWTFLLFLPASLLFGMYSETTSFAVILMALGLLIARHIDRGSWKSRLWIPLVLMVAGYILMVTMPAEQKLKTGSLEFWSVLAHFSEVCGVCTERFLIPMISWAVLMVLACLRGTDAKRRVVSLAFALGAAASAGVLSAASYVALRSLCTCALFLVIANVILLADLLAQGEKVLCLCLSAALCVAFSLSLVTGVYDNFRSYTQSQAQKAAIAQALREGERSVVVEQLSPKTEYSAAYGTVKLSATDPRTFPNRDMAEYYGLDSILGK